MVGVSRMRAKKRAEPRDIDEDIEVALTGVLTYAEMARALDGCARILGAERTGFLRLPRPALGALGQEQHDAARSEKAPWPELAQREVVALSPARVAVQLSAASYPARGFAAALFERAAGFSTAEIER